MKVTFLGTGTSVGIPVIGCDCEVCTSDDPRNNRTRASVYVQGGGVDILVDTPPDFRMQALREDITHIDAVLFTHAHADHIFGFDDIRRFNTIQGHTMIPAYAGKETRVDLERIFPYVVPEKPAGLFRPIIEWRTIEGPFQVGEMDITPLPVRHGGSETLGFKFVCDGKSVGYVPDCYEMPEETKALVRNVDVMILDALKPTPHKTHLTVDQSAALLRDLGAKDSYLIHMCHDVEHAKTEESLPEGIHISYDGLVLDV
jgi:phosphoribosyl 1,2-cyclic phosphate phosphodiesterase